MITQEPTLEMLEEWKAIWRDYHGKLCPNRRSGTDVLEFLKCKYSMTEIDDQNVLAIISANVTENAHLAAKLPEGADPIPRAFYLENIGEGKTLYRPENRDSLALWGGVIERIFVGLDLASGFYMVEGSTLLWEELCAFQGLDEIDLQNYVSVSQYIKSLQRLGALERVIGEL